MSLIKAVPLKNFLSNSLSTTAVSTAYEVGAATTGQKAYFGMHLTSASLGTTARVLVMTVQSATASGFGSPTTRATFTLSTQIGGQWGTPVGALSTEHKWWRTSWTLSTAASTGGTWKGLVYMGIR
jgi:hypothetical protein